MKEWIIPVVIAIVWILNAVLRNRENDEPVRPRVRGTDRPGNRQATNEIDRFLQEIERLKKKTPNGRPVAPPVNRAPLPKTKTAPGRPRPPAARVRVKVVEAPAPAAAAVEAGPPPAPVAVASLQALIPTTPTVTRPQRSAPVIAEATRLLRSPHSAASAIVLMELLGPPKCKRR